jgi:hypothetical protein
MLMEVGLKRRTSLIGLLDRVSNDFAYLFPFEITDFLAICLVRAMCILNIEYQVIL